MAGRGSAGEILLAVGGCLLLLFPIVIASGVACGGTKHPVATPSPEATAGSPVSPTAAPPPTETPTPLVIPEHPDYYASNTRSGTAAVDAALDMVAAGDVAGLVARVRFSPAPCHPNPMGVASPPKCPEGQPAGTLVMVFPGNICEGTFQDLAGIQRWLSEALARSPRIYAVYDPGKSLWPLLQSNPPDYVVMFGFLDQQPAGVFRLWVLKDGALTGFDLCPPPGTLVRPDARSFLLPPLP